MARRGARRRRPLSASHFEGGAPPWGASSRWSFSRVTAKVGAPGSVEAKASVPAPIRRAVRSQDRTHDHDVFHASQVERVRQLPRENRYGREGATGERELRDRAEGARAGSHQVPSPREAGRGLGRGASAPFSKPLGQQLLDFGLHRGEVGRARRERAAGMDQADDSAAIDQEADAVFFFKDSATTEIYTLSLHAALPI